MGKKYFSKNILKIFKTIFKILKRIENDFSNFELQRKKKLFSNFAKRFFFVFKVQNDFYSFSKKILFSPKFRFQNLIIFKVQMILICFPAIFQLFSSRFPAVLSMKTKFFVFTKISFSKSNRFQMLQKDFFRFPAVL